MQKEKSHPLSRQDGQASCHLFSLDKLMSVAENLTRSHIAIVNKHSKLVNRYGSEQMNADKPAELTFNFVRSLLLDNIIENPVLKNAILTNQIANLSQLEAFTKVTYTSKFQ